MISKMFLQAVKLCLSASIVTGLVLLLRFAFKKAPKSLVCALWILVGLRLVIPTMPSSSVSVIPEAVSGGTAVEALEKQYVEETTVIREDQNEELYKQITSLYRDLPVYREAGTSYVVVAAPASQSAAPAAQPSAPASQPAAPTAPAAAAYAPPKTFGDSVVPTLSVVWIVGVGIMLLYMMGSFWRLHRRLRTAVILEKGVWESDQISSPFILGIIRPRIYLPISLSEEEREFVLAHEKTHLKRGDQFWKPLGYLLLAVYWFNPLFWLAYFLLCRDIESACDERVIRSEGTAYRKAYSETLLKLNVRQNAVTACPLAFAENGVGGRIRRVLNYKKPAFWVIAAALIIGVVSAGCALTDPTKKETPAAESTEQTESEASTEESTEAESTEPESTAAESTPEETQRGGQGLEAAEKLLASFPSGPDGPIWPDDLGGWYMEEYQDGKEMILCLKDPDEAMIKRYLDIVAGYENSVHIKAVRYSQNELHQTLMEIVENLLAKEIYNQCYLDAENNGIVVGVEETCMETVRAELQQKYPDIHIVMEIAQQYPVRPQTTFEILYTDEKALDANTREKLVSFIGNDYKPLPWAFLRQDFRDPSEIDVIDLFYNWTEELSGEAEQEAAWKAGHMEELRLETQKRTAKGMNEVFRKYTGKELTKEQTDAFSTWIYLPEYDAYYSFQTDSMPQGAELGRACFLDEKDAADLGLKAGYEQLIALEWYTLDEGARDETGMLLLVPCEDSWQIVANLFYKEPEPVQAERTACTTKVLEGSMKDEKAGLTFIDGSPVYTHGPCDFALISENDIIILDYAANRLQRYKDGQYFETISLPERPGLRLCVMGENAYVLRGDSLLKIDLNTKEQRTVALPYLSKDEGVLGTYVDDMFEQDGKLYLITELYGNFCLNEETQKVEKTSSANTPYSVKRTGGIGGKEIAVIKGARRWTVDAPNRYGYVIGFGEDGIVYFYLYDLNLNREDEGYCRILKCAAGEGVAAESIVDVSKWIILSHPQCFAKLGADGSVYVLALHEDDFVLYKLNVGVEDIREQ